MAAWERHKQTLPAGVAEAIERAWARQIHLGREIERANVERAAKSPVDAARTVARHSQTHFAIIRDGLDKMAAGAQLAEEVDLQYKHFFEDLRSALDYIAVEVAVRYCGVSRDAPNIESVTFPYARPNENETEVRRKVEWRFPGLSQTNPDLFDLSVALASRTFEGKPWIWRINELVIRLKHRGFLTRTVGLAYTREGIERIGTTAVATTPSRFWDAIQFPDGESRTFNLSEFSSESATFVARAIEEMARLART